MNQPSAGLSLSTRHCPATSRIHLVRLGGELTAEAARALAQWVEQICASYLRAIHVDVGELDYIDDDGAWTLALALQCVRFHGNPVNVYNVPFPLRCVLDAVLIKPGPGPQSFDRREAEDLSTGPRPSGWLAMDLRICHEDPHLASIFLIFDRLGCGQGPPANAVLSSQWEIRG